MDNSDVFLFFLEHSYRCPRISFEPEKAKDPDARMSIGSVPSPLLIIIIPPTISNTIKPKGTTILEAP